jgi:hypothetical protein
MQMIMVQPVMFITLFNLYKVHPTFGAFSRRIINNFGMHWA